MQSNDKTKAIEIEELYEQNNALYSELENYKG